MLQLPRLFAAPAFVAAAWTLGGGPAPAAADPAPNEERIAALEARVAELEAFLAASMGYGEQTQERAVAESELRLPAVVTHKHFQSKDPAHARWEDFVDLDVEYDTTPLAKPAAAIKGTLVFSDAFGQVRFEMPTEITDRIEPGSPLPQKGLSFKYNQFRDAHQWMNATDPKKMQVALHVTTVLYRDGTNADYR